MNSVLKYVWLSLFLAFLLCNVSCSKQSFHQKHNWKAENFFSDKQIVSLCKAIEANDLDEMKRLIDAGVDINAKGKGNMTPLLWSMYDKHPERVVLLLKKGADPNVYTTSDFGMPFAFAPGDSVTHKVCRMALPYFDEVFEYGGDPNFPDKRIGTSGATPIFTVIKGAGGGQEAKRRIDVLLKKGADINKLTSTTPLIQAESWGGQYDLAMFLIEKGADYKAYSGNDRLKLIHLLAEDVDGLLRTATPQQKADYDKLVKFLEERGETIEEAKKDWKRWESYGPDLSQQAAQFKQEVEERKRKEKEAAEKKGN